MDFSQLLSSISVEAFRDEYWERKPLRVSAEDPSAVTNLLTLEALERSLCEGWFPAELVSLNRRGDVVDPLRYCTPHPSSQAREFYRIHWERVFSLVGDGHTMVVSQPHTYQPALGRLCDGIATALRARVHVNAYLTPPNSRGFGPHWDTHDVFVVQLRGRKRWRLFGSPHPLPLRTDSFRRAAVSIGDPKTEITLDPGDVLYVPRGHIHEAEALDQVSLHATIGVSVPRWSDFLSELLLVAAYRDVALRESLPPRAATSWTDDDRNDEVRRRLRAILTPENIRAATNGVAGRFCAEDSSPPQNRLSQTVEAVECGLHSVCEPSPGLSVSASAEGEGVQLKLKNRSLVFPSILDDEVQFVATSPRFRVRDIPDALDDEAKIALTRRLLEGGFLRIASEGNAHP